MRTGFIKENELSSALESHSSRWCLNCSPGQEADLWC